ncbi:aldo-keto reductase [Aspergillus sclerotiicarbonarius CBS 121057]|uniref:D-xylose reductase [NAD(P)H] n=1 Tax=Aspergillus sclerotiicarbonarius (strain CBS 121057 / IBT 28362) TaxID=1448318 RepID=A0A319E5P6_ASPSB|nr:aldo-keto reductase [Aspergillus sclerotiicarbonarius CBS 121057]
MSANYSLTDLLPLPNSSVKVPRLGFGVYRSPSTQCVQSCLKALETGYRHIDTAQFYANEKDVGDAIRSSGLPRGEIFVTTKILSPAGSPEATYERLVASVDKIGGKDGYVDLFLIHSSKSGSSGRKELWQALERLLEEGRTKTIGVSNFGVRHIEEMKAYAKVWPPHVNQIELHPWCQQRVIDAYCKKNGIVVESYSPIVRNYKANDPTLVDLAKKYNKTTQQVLIRYALQKGWVPLPKTDNPDRIVANANVFDFDISEEDMAVLNALDQGSSGAIVEAVENE